MKGGEFAYDTKTARFTVDNPGDSSHTEIVRVEITEYDVVLHTSERSQIGSNHEATIRRDE